MRTIKATAYSPTAPSQVISTQDRSGTIVPTAIADPTPPSIPGYGHRQTVTARAGRPYLTIVHRPECGTSAGVRWPPKREASRGTTYTTSRDFIQTIQAPEQRKRCVGRLCRVRPSPGWRGVGSPGRGTPDGVTSTAARTGRWEEREGLGPGRHPTLPVRAGCRSPVPPSLVR